MPLGTNTSLTGDPLSFILGFLPGGSLHAISSKEENHPVIFLCNSFSHSCEIHFVLGLLTGQDFSQVVKESLIRNDPLAYGGDYHTLSRDAVLTPICSPFSVLGQRSQ